MANFIKNDLYSVMKLADNMDLEDKLIKVMEDKVESIIGEDGLTVWDFAELRDSLLELFEANATLVLHQRNITLIQKLEGMRRDWRKQKAENGLMWNDGYNQAIDDCIKVIKGK